MAAKPPPRSVLKMILTNFINSFKPRQIKGNLIGEDYFGNKYYEIPANPAIGKRRPSRWFEPKEKDAYDQELTAEWESWLRGRRSDPPTREELIQNLSIMEMKKVNASKLQEKYPREYQKDQQVTGASTFPAYGDEYEKTPGKDT